MGEVAAPPSAWGRSLVLVGLAAVAVTQPVLDLMGQNPEFFVAGAYTSAQIVAFAVIVVVVPVIVLVGVYLLVRWIHRTTSEVVHGVLVAALGAVFGNVLLRGLGLDGLGPAVLAGLGGAALVLVLSRSRPGGLLLQYLAAAQLLFIVAFLTVSPAGALISSTPDLDALGSVTVPVPPGPVVVIVFDELPLPTLLGADGTINAERYPAFARLAEASTWFRNASSSHNHTELAVPDLATGTVVDDGTLPTQAEHPRNLLALMSTAMPVHRLEPVTDLCPRNACDRRDGHALTQAIEDSAIVYGHRVLPPSLRDDLPSIDGTWGSFGGSVDEAEPSSVDPLGRWHTTSETEKAAASQNDLLVEHGTAVDATPALHFLHVVTPHVPWDATPWGTKLMGPMPTWRDDPLNPDSRWSALVRYQRHSLQTGAADAALGEVLDHLQSSGAWDDTTLLVIADHGTGTVWPDVRRERTPNNQDEVLRVPMFLKAPGQEQGEVVDDPAMTIDALPTLLDVLDVDVDWDFDGHSLLDGSGATTDPLVRSDIDDLFAVVRHHADDFPHGWDWVALAAVGEHGGMVGSPVHAYEMRRASEMTWASPKEDSFGSLPTPAGEVPQLLTGVIDTPDGREPPALVVAVNGTIAGVTGGYEPADGGYAFSSTLGPYFVDGANRVVLYEVVAGSQGAVLRPLG